MYVLLEKQSAGVSFNGIQALQQCYINPAMDNTAYIYRSATSVYQVGCYVMRRKYAGRRFFVTRHHTKKRNLGIM